MFDLHRDLQQIVGGEAPPDTLTPKQQLLIGVFDSGVGGLSILREIRARMPMADLLYLADHARSPYGPRPLVEVQEIAHQVTAWLVDNGSSTIVVACNTASAAALDSLRESFPTIPIVGMEPAVKPASLATRTGVIAVFATEATFQGRLFESLLDSYAGEITVLPRACPEWVALVESNHISDAEARRSVAEAVNPILEQGADVLVLGCTHYSFLKSIIEEVAGPQIQVVDPAPAVAKQTVRVASRPGETSTLALATSGNPEALIRAIADLIDLQWTGTVLPFSRE